MQTTQTASLFERIGGMPAVNAAVDIFYDKVIQDETVNYYFLKIDLDKQRPKLKMFLAFAFGAPTTYSGKNMRNAHAHMAISETQFNTVASHLVATLEELNVDPSMIDEVIVIAESTKNDIVKH